MNPKKGNPSLREVKKEKNSLHSDAMDLLFRAQEGLTDEKESESIRVLPVRIPDSLHKKLKAVSRLLGKSMSQIIVERIENLPAMNELAKIKEIMAQAEQRKHELEEEIEQKKREELEKFLKQKMTD